MNLDESLVMERIVLDESDVGGPWRMTMFDFFVGA